MRTQRDPRLVSLPFPKISARYPSSRAHYCFFGIIPLKQGALLFRQAEALTRGHGALLLSQNRSHLKGLQNRLAAAAAKKRHHWSQKCTRYALIRRATCSQIIFLRTQLALKANNRIFNLINQMVSRWIFMPRLRPTFLATLNDAPGYLVAWTRQASP